RTAEQTSVPRVRPALDAVRTRDCMTPPGRKRGERRGNERPSSHSPQRTPNFSYPPNSRMAQRYRSGTTADRNSLPNHDVIHRCARRGWEHLGGARCVMFSSHVHGIVSVPSVFCVFGIRLVAVSPNPSASTTDNVVELVTDPVAPEFTVKLQTASVTGVV